MITVYHWSKRADLTDTDPAYAGTGTRGAERDRDQVRGTYFAELGYREYAVQANAHRYRAELDSERVYCLDSDPLGLVLTAQQSGGNARFEFEKLVLNQGFIGYKAQDVYKIFVPVKIQLDNPHGA